MKIQKSKLDKILNILCIVILIATPIALAILWPEIPKKLPMHYDLYGNVTRYGVKSELIIIPFISFLLYGLITLIEYIPEAWNTGVIVTEENKERVYTILYHLISTVKFLIVFSFNVPIILTLTLNIKLSPIFLLIIMLGNANYWIYKLYKAK